MTKSEKRINVKERVEDDTIDLSLSDITDIPVKDIVRWSLLLMQLKYLILEKSFFQAAIKRATVLDLSSNRIVTLGVRIICL